MIRESRQLDWQEYEYPSTAVIELVAEATGRDQTELAPLYDHVDSDALDSLLTGPSEGDLELSFDYDDVFVRVTGSGVVEVRELGPRVGGVGAGESDCGQSSPD